MKNIKTYEDFVNEEINLKKALAGAALGAGLAFGNPAMSQTTQTNQEISNVIKDTKLSGWENLKWGDSVELVKEKNPKCVDVNKEIANDIIMLSINEYQINGVSFRVSLIFDDSRKLKSVLLESDWNFPQVKSFKEYFNTEYWEGNQIGDNRFKWDGEMGNIELIENQYTISTDTRYMLSIEYSKSDNKAPIVSMTDSQKFDMLRNELIKMKDEQTEVKLNLYKCHKEFKVGVGLVGAGIGLGILGTAQLLNNPSGSGKEIAIIGSILSLAGSIVIVDSHKFIARASLTGIKVEFGGKPSYKKVQPGDYFLYMGPE